MQRKVIALAVAGLISGGAFAQSNVTVYGLFDVFTGVGKADNTTGNQSQTVVNSGVASKLGFTGEEALGNGLKAIFRFEMGPLDYTGATNNIGNTRQGWVGFKSDTLGTAYMGRVQTLGWEYAIKYDIFGGFNGFSVISPIGKGVNLLISSGSTLGRQANAVSYISPSLGGVTIRGDVAAGEQVTGTNGAAGVNKAQTYYSLGADYDNGPLSAGLAFAKLRDLNGTLNNVNGVDVTDWALAGKYDFKVVKPYLLYQESKNRLINTTQLTNKVWSAGLEIPVGAARAGAVKLAYVNFKNDATLQAKAQGWSVAYEQYLSKRTTVYAGYQSINNGANATFTGNATTVATSADKNASFYGLGMRHAF